MKKTLGITAVVVFLMFLGMLFGYLTTVDSGEPGPPVAFFLFTGFTLLGLAVWIAGIVDAAFVPSERWKRAGLDKTTWIVLILSANFVGAVAYFGWIRKRLKAR